MTNFKDDLIKAGMFGLVGGAASYLLLGEQSANTSLPFLPIQVLT
mgnify:CR=1 FL=1